jgi:hypothetical protein
MQTGPLAKTWHPEPTSVPFLDLSLGQEADHQNRSYETYSGPLRFLHVQFTEETKKGEVSYYQYDYSGTNLYHILYRRAPMI